MTDALVAYSADRGIARIALDSPRNRNALSAALMTQRRRRWPRRRPTTASGRWS